MSSHATREPLPPRIASRGLRGMHDGWTTGMESRGRHAGCPGCATKLHLHFLSVIFAIPPLSMVQCFPLFLSPRRCLHCGAVCGREACGGRPTSDRDCFSDSTPQNPYRRTTSPAYPGPCSRISFFVLSHTWSTVRHGGQDDPAPSGAARKPAPSHCVVGPGEAQGPQRLQCSSGGHPRRRPGAEGLPAGEQVVGGPCFQHAGHKAGRDLASGGCSQRIRTLTRR
jgi:hypothetical protein